MTNILNALNWRYATKTFDATKKIAPETWEKIEEVMRLSPSSFGLQPWKFVVVTDQKTKEALKPLSWDQTQVTDCSHLVVMCRRTDVDESLINHFIETTANTRGQELSELEQYKNMMLGFAERMSEEQIQQWTAKQVYIALGQTMAACALMEIDTCPMEGFSGEGYDKILGLQAQKLASVVVLPCGYRSSEDLYAKKAKVRFEKSEVIVEGVMVGDED